MRRLPSPLPCLGVFLVLAATPLQAPAQAVQRCMDASGRTVFTDRRCADVGAAERLPAPVAPVSHGSRRGPLPGGCPRTAAQLAGELGAALRAGDTNRLTGLYDWSGVSSAAASRVLEQLERVAARPVLDIAPVLSGGDAGGPAVSPAVAPAPSPTVVASRTDTSSAPPREGPARWLPGWMRLGAAADPERSAGNDAVQAGAGAGAAMPVPASEPVAAPRPRVTGLRVEQTLPGTATPSRTVFSLRRRYGCLWLRL